VRQELEAESAVRDGEIACLDELGRSQLDELLFDGGEPRFLSALAGGGKHFRFDSPQDARCISSVRSCASFS